MNRTLHWKQIAALSGNCVKELDANGNVVAVNGKCVELFEAESEQQLLGKHWTDLWPSSMRTTVEDALNKARRGESAHFAGESPTLRGNVRSWEVNITPSPPGSDPSHFLVLRHDVTVLKQANAALQTLNAALRKQITMQRQEETVPDRYDDMILQLQNDAMQTPMSQIAVERRDAENSLDLANAATLVAEAAIAQAHKERVISQVVGGVAHDLNNMLASTIMSLCMIRDHLDDPAKLARFLRYATEGSEQAARLSKRLMAFTRTHEIEMVDLDLGSVVEEICSFVAHSLGGRCQLKWMRAEGAHPIIADAHLIEQALVNLCINARHASADGGIIEIRLDTMTVDEDDSANERAGNYVTLSVIDQGAGMTPEVQSRLFEPYFTTKRRGSGLGLAQVYGLMRLVGGFVRVESKLGRGTTVLLAFPKARDAGVAADKTPVRSRPLND